MHRLPVMTNHVTSVNCVVSINCHLSAFCLSSCTLGVKKFPCLQLLSISKKRTAVSKIFIGWSWTRALKNIGAVFCLPKRN